ncbi:uncharacterized protein TNCV_499881 [Trichonephila clavipes]|nr:uncharacterized protein TNCV_499881 [Trichonephila clavipes]
MDVCKCIVLSRHGATLNSRRAVSHLVWLVEREERWGLRPPPECSRSKLGWTEPNRTATCMVLKATANERRHLALCHGEFRGPRSGLCRSGAIGNNNNCTRRTEVDMSLRRFRRQYEQLSQFERGRIIGMMEAGCSGRRVSRELGRSDCVVRRCWDQWIRSERCYLHENQAQDALDRPVVKKTATS